MDERQSKSFIVNACSFDKSESKSVHVSVNTSEVKDAMGETKDEEISVTKNSVINEPSNFKLFECSKNLLNNIDAMYERACMKTLQGKWDTEKLMYGQACLLEKK